MAEPLFDADELDVFGEIVNIGMGKAGAALADVFAGFVHLRVPEIKVVGAAAIAETRDRLLRTYDRVSLMHQEFFGELAGDIAVVYGPASYAALRAVLGFDDREGNGRRQREELLLELGNALAATCVSEIGEQIGLRTGIRPPRVAVFDSPADAAAQRLFDDSPAWQGQTLQIAILFQLADHALPFELLVTVAPACLPKVKQALAARH